MEDRQVPLSGDEQFCPIAALSVYLAHWTLKARVWKKSKIQQWKNERSAGKLFHASLIDSQGDEISTTFFNSAVDKFFPVLQENRAYLFSKGKLLKSNPKFRVTDCDLHINFDERAIITEMADESAENALTLHPTITPLASIPALVSSGKMSFVNVCAVVADTGTAQEVVSRQGGALKKREITICDRSEFPMKLTLWGEEAELPLLDREASDDIVVVAHKVQTCVFRESLLLTTSLSATKLIFNPDTPDANDLLNWWRHERTSVSKSKAHRYLTISQLLSYKLSPSCYKSTFCITARINYIRNDADTQLWYESCPHTSNCKKKLRRTGDSFSCESCNEQFEHCAYRYCASMWLVDETEGLWATAFDDPFRSLIGVDAETAQRMGDSEELGRKVADLLNTKKTFTIEKKESRGKVRYTIEKVEQADERLTTKRAIGEIERLMMRR